MSLSAYPFCQGEPGAMGLSRIPMARNVDHHNVPPLECWDQTLLYVSQEGLAIHGSFDQRIMLVVTAVFIDKYAWSAMYRRATGRR
jgi:hypothetical protein